MQNTTLRVRADAPIGVISPRLYGQFAEHLGRCCYDGVFVGDSYPGLAREQGFRGDALAALKAMPTPLLRWPGGCYADHYHWRDGVGPAAERPRRLGMSCDLQVEDDNSLGTHEFLWLCATLGAEPYLAGNVGTGSPQELCDWLEYCNSARDTTLTRLRAANGAQSPFGVKLWGVGNENWGCGGNFDAASYAREYRRYATMLRHVDPTAELVACGGEDDWNAELVRTLGPHLSLVDHLSIHRYWNHGGPALAFDEQGYYTLLSEADATEDFIRRTAVLVREATGGQRRIGVALDEWGVWAPDAQMTNQFEEPSTLRDALAAAAAMEGFHRQCDALSMANLAQVANILQAPVRTEGPRMYVTPTYHVFRLHAPHHGATALPVAVEGGASLPDGSPAVSATASRAGAGFAVTVMNRHLTAEAGVRLVCPGGRADASAALLAAAEANATNSPDHPDAVAPVALAVARDGDGWRVELPPHSLATVLL